MMEKKRGTPSAELMAPPPQPEYWRVTDRQTGASGKGFGQTAWQAWQDAALKDDEGQLLTFSMVVVTFIEPKKKKKPKPKHRRYRRKGIRHAKNKKTTSTKK